MAEYYSVIGAFVCGVGGAMLSLALIGGLCNLACALWIWASNKFRAICKAESLIFEYKKNRQEFLIWKNRREGGA